ncbi:MAG: hypothetical protein AB8U44_02595, partial [Aaplasma endosymbiont of Hyalomma asiaticum]
MSTKSKNTDSYEKLVEAIVAMQQGNFEKFHKTVRSVPGNELNMHVDDFGRTLQHYASAVRDRRFYDCAVSCGCSVTNKDRRGISPEEAREELKALQEEW